MRLLIAAALLSLAEPAIAQVDYPPAATREEIAAVKASIPVPADAVPPMEVPSGTSGSAATYRRGDAVQPRISRSALLAVGGASGMITATWATPLPAGYASYPVYFTPKGVAGAKPVKCTVITATNSGFTAQCMQDADIGLTLSLLTAAGLSGLVLPVSAYAAAGTQIFALQLPSTQ